MIEDRLSSTFLSRKLVCSSTGPWLGPTGSEAEKNTGIIHLSFNIVISTWFGIRILEKYQQAKFGESSRGYRGYGCVYLGKIRLSR